MTTAATTKAVCLPQYRSADVIFKLREKTHLDIPEQNALQIKLEEVLKIHFSDKLEVVIADAPATIDGSSRDTKAVIITHHDDPASSPQQQTRNEGQKGSNSSSDEADDLFSSATSKLSSPPSSTRNLSPASAKRLSWDSVTQKFNTVSIADISDDNNGAPEPDALSGATFDKATPQPNNIVDAPSSDDHAVSIAPKEAIVNDNQDLPATEDFHVPHSIDSSPASVHTGILSDDTPHSAATERSFESLSLERFPASRSQSSASSTQAWGDLSFEEQWRIIWDSETGGLSLGSHYLAAYASPVRNGHRIRTSCDSDADPGRWHVDPDGFINELGRAGGPFLPPLPLKDSDSLKETNRHPIRKLLLSWGFMCFVPSIMAKYNIQPTSMEFYKAEWIQNWSFPNTFCLTFEATRDTIDNAWPGACREIYAYILEHCEGNPMTQSVSVEIRDPAFHKFPIRANWQRKPPDLPLDDLASQLLEAIDTRDLYDTKWWYMQRTPYDEKVFAFCLRISYMSSRDWRIPREQMVAVLDKNNLSDVAILIVKDDCWGEGREMLF